LAELDEGFVASLNLGTTLELRIEDDGFGLVIGVDLEVSRIPVGVFDVFFTNEANWETVVEDTELVQSEVCRLRTEVVGMFDGLAEKVGHFEDG
jgi:hypothetical protein